MIPANPDYVNAVTSQLDRDFEQIVVVRRARRTRPTRHGRRLVRSVWRTGRVPKLTKRVGAADPAH